MDLVIKATHFAAEKHHSQRRKNKDKDPYINHPIHVASLLSEANVNDHNTICAALLHDTVEDTDATYEEIVNEFGEKIADIVMEVTDDKSLPKVERKKLQIEHAKHASDEAKLVKICDKYSNLHAIKQDPPANWSPEICHGYAVWCYAVCKNLFGINPALDTLLKDLFKELQVSADNLQQQLEAYYNLI